MKSSEHNSAELGGITNKLLGCWKLVSYRARDVDDNTEKDLYGPNPKGYYLFTKDRLAAILAPGQREFPKTEAEAAAMLSAFTAYTSKYVFDDEKFVFTPDVSHNEFYVGKEQTRYYKIDGDRLRLHTDAMAPANDPSRRIIGTIEFCREK